MIYLFYFLIFTERQVEHLKDQYHIYTLRSGRINICALTDKNIDYVAEAFHDAVTLFPDPTKNTV